MFRIVIALYLASTFVHAASQREIAEWAIRWEGRVTLEGSRKPLHDISQLPAGEFRIVGIDLTGAVMYPTELEKLGGLLTSVALISSFHASARGCSLWELRGRSQ